MKNLLLSLIAFTLYAAAAPLIATSQPIICDERDERQDIFYATECELYQKGFRIEKIDSSRPWGGFFVIDEAQAQEFANTYFEGMDINELKIAGKLSPKILLVAPNKRLSWQYHHRRAEIWRVLSGYVGVMISDTDIEEELKVCRPGELIYIKQGKRHRLVGLEEWGVVAEIWQHTDVQYPSDESDIVRVLDDFGR